VNEVAVLQSQKRQARGKLRFAGKERHMMKDFDPENENVRLMLNISYDRKRFTNEIHFVISRSEHSSLTFRMLYGGRK